MQLERQSNAEDFFAVLIVPMLHEFQPENAPNLEPLQAFCVFFTIEIHGFIFELYILN